MFLVKAVMFYMYITHKPEAFIFICGSYESKLAVSHVVSPLFIKNNVLWILLWNIVLWILQAVYFCIMNKNHRKWGKFQIDKNFIKKKIYFFLALVQTNVKAETSFKVLMGHMKLNITLLNWLQAKLFDFRRFYQQLFNL